MKNNKWLMTRYPVIIKGLYWGTKILNPLAVLAVFAVNAMMLTLCVDMMCLSLMSHVDWMTIVLGVVAVFVASSVEMFLTYVLVKNWFEAKQNMERRLAAFRKMGK